MLSFVTSRLFDRAGGVCFKGAVLAVSPSADKTAIQFKANAAQAGSSTPSTSASSPGTTTGVTSDPAASSVDQPTGGASSANPPSFKTAAITVAGLVASGVLFNLV